MKKLVITLFAFGALLGIGSVVPATASADTAKETVCAALGSDAKCADQTPNGGINVNRVVKIVVNTLSVVVGIVAVIMIILGGLKLTTSSGDSSKISSGRNTITYAIIGLVIVAVAQGIVQFTLGAATAPSCSNNQVVDSKTNTCVQKK